MLHGVNWINAVDLLRSPRLVGAPGTPQSCLQGNPYLTKNPIKLAVTVFPLLNWPKHCQCLEELRAISSDALYIFVRFTVFLLFEKLYYTTKGYLFSE